MEEEMAVAENILAQKTAATMRNSTAAIQKGSDAVLIPLLMMIVVVVGMMLLKTILNEE